MNVLRFFYARSRLLISVAFCSAIASGVFGTALIKVMTDGIMGSAVALRFGAIFFGLCLGVLVTRTCTQLIVLRLTQDAVFDMRLRISSRILASPLRKLEDIGSPKLLVVLSKDIENFANCLQIVPQVFASGVIVAFSLAYLAWLSWTWFLLFAAVLVACFIAFRVAQRFPSSQIRVVRERLDVVYRLFRDLLEGTKELQLNKLRGEHFVANVIGPEAQAYRQVFVRGFSAFIWIANIGDVVFYAVIGLLLFVAPGWMHMDMPTDLRIRIGLTLLYLIGPISAISNAVPVIGQASVALDKITKLDVDLHQRLPAPQEADPFAEPAAAGPLLELKDVAYEYTAPGETTRFRLGPLNLGIPQGQIAFIVGANGSGKSTLVKILSGLYAPESGEVCLNGVPVTATNIDHYRRRFSAVFSDFYLFDHLMGVGGTDAGELASIYLKKLKIDHKVRVEGGRFSTVSLSSGQKKRLALIVSYLEDRPIYVFDEWAADQDPVFKNFFYTELLPEMKLRGKTVIVISHDDAYFHHADHLFRIDGETARPASSPEAEDLAVCD